MEDDDGSEPKVERSGGHMDDGYPIPAVTEAEFPWLQAIMKIEAAFPTTYAGWQRTWEIRRQQEEANGFKVRLIEVRPPGFASFCKTRSIPANWHGLMLYVRAKAGR